MIMNNSIQTIINRSKNLGFIGSNEEILNQITNKYNQFQTEEEKLNFAHQVAGKYNLSTFLQLV